MVNGIEILKSNNILIINPIIMILCIFLIFTAILFLILSILFAKKTNKFIILELINLLLIIIVLCLISYDFMGIDTGRKRYEIKVNKNVTVQELYDKYNIIKYDEDNKIFTVEDKK